MDLKKRLLGYCLSAASVYVTMNYLTRLFVELLSNFTFTVT
ncbi:MAG: hypothetical protein OEZ44_11420 [Candidatus Bathyarchaeota archaeon]|nr:hypothetical protein [Candidatus Bathyarchaeota archaeon]